MDSADSAMLCALYHLCRAQLLIDAATDFGKVNNPKVIKAIKAELALAGAVLGQPERSSFGAVADCEASGY